MSRTLTVRSFPDDDVRENGKLCKITYVATNKTDTSHNDGGGCLNVYHGNAGEFQKAVNDREALATAVALESFDYVIRETPVSFAQLDAREQAVVRLFVRVGALRMFGGAMEDLFFANISVV